VNSSEPSYLVRAEHVDAEGLRAAIDAVRLAEGPLFTNYFLTPIASSEIPLWSSADTVVFLEPLRDFDRLHFVTRDPADLGRVLARVEGRRVVADYFFHGEEPPALEQAFRGAGLPRAARYLRLRRRRARPAFTPPAAVARAREDEIDTLFDLLERDFDPRFDHTPARDEFAALVRAGQVLVQRTDASIEGYVVYRASARSGTFDYLACRDQSSPWVLGKLIADFETDLDVRGVEVVSMWVDERKQAVIATHERFGYASDGMIRASYAQAAAPPTARAVAPTELAPAPPLRPAAAAVDPARAAVERAIAALHASSLRETSIPPGDASLRALDSLALVNLVVHVEDAIGWKPGTLLRSIAATTREIASAEMAGRRGTGGSPLSTVGDLVEHVARLLARSPPRASISLKPE
jgi:hypothetical protein